MKTAVYRKAHFNAAHRLHNPKWSDEQNREVFGKCNNPHFHGHNYELVVKVIGEIEPESGYVLDLKLLKHLIETQIIERFDHKNLNVEVPEFQELNPTAENIAAVIWRILSRALPAHLEVKIILYETERNFVEYPA